MTNTSPAEFYLTKKGAGATFWLCLSLGLALAALGIFLLFAIEDSSAAKRLAGALPIILGLGVVLFGYWWRNRALNDREPRLIIDSKSIHAPKIAAKPIPWTSVEKIVMAKGGYSKFKNRHYPDYLAIDVDDPKAFAPNFMSRMLSGANRRLAGGEFIVYTENLEGDFETIKAALLTANPSLTLEEKSQV